MSETYRYREGSRQKLSAQVVGESLELIRLTHGGEITPETVVEEAKVRNHPLHNGFEWNNAKCGVEYRLVQARAMIRSVVVVPEAAMGEKVPPTVRAFVITGDIPNQRYTSTYTAMADVDMRAQVLQRALRELRQWRQRYQDLEELAAIFEAMDQQAA